MGYRISHPIAIITAALLLPVGLGACTSADEGQDSAPSEVSTTEAGPSEPEVQTEIPEELLELVGLPLREFTERVTALRYTTVHEAKRDGEVRPAEAVLNPNRVNVETMDGVVTKITHLG